MKIYKKRKKVKMCVILAAFLVTTLSLQGCELGTPEEQADCPYEEFIVVDVFDKRANYQGIQSGWFGKIVKDKFNMELNIIAPNISGGGDTLQEVRSAAGNLGDLIICNGENGVMQNMVNAGLLYNMKDALKDKQIMRYENAIEILNQGITPEGIYAVPSELSVQSPDTPSEGAEPAYGPYVRWDLYAKLGYPEMNTLEDLLPVLKEMQELCPVNEKGEKTYAFSFFKDWDDNMMNAIKQPCCLYGYDEYGFVLAKADGSDYQSIIEDDSLYIRVCRLFYEANQMGLVDPDSVRQNYEECFIKYRDGRVLFSYWPWLGQPAYNTFEHTSEGKGFMLAPIRDMQIYSYGCNPDGNQQNVIAVGSKAKDPERLVDFIDWLYSPEGISMNCAHLSGSTAGPEGLTWEMGENGPVLTEFGKQALLSVNVTVPEEYGGGMWENGTSVLNYKPISRCEKNPDGYYYAYELWDSVIELNSTPLVKDWQRVMQATSTKDYLQQHNMLLVAPGCAYQAPAETSDQSAIRSQCKRAIQNYSWKLVFARDETEFNDLLKTLQETVKSYGYEEILAYDMENAKAKIKAGEEAVAEYKKGE